MKYGNHIKKKQKAVVPEHIFEEHYNQEVIALRLYLSLKHIESVHLDIM